MKYQIIDINERLKRTMNDLNDVVSSIESAFDNIQNAPRSCFQDILEAIDSFIYFNGRKR